MRSLFKTAHGLLLTVAALTSVATGEKQLVSNSLSACQQDSGLTASHFRIAFKPESRVVTMNITLTSSIQGMVLFDTAITAYGYQVFRGALNPCDMDLGALCPMNSGRETEFNLSFPVGGDVESQIPGIAFQAPDLDAVARIYVNRSETGESLACLEAGFSNGKTVNLLSLKWITAIIASLALLASGIVNGLGHFNTAAHVAANSLSVFSYFQAQAIIGLTAVPLPPVVRAWTLNFQWSMGIIRVGFLQDIFTWFQQSTGGTVSHILNALTKTSVQVTKRSIIYVDGSIPDIFRREASGLDALVKRANIATDYGTYIVYGIQRVAFQCGIESSNLFMTVLLSFYIFVLFVLLAVAAFKVGCELCARKKWINQERFREFRSGWKIFIKGILFRIALVGFTPLSIICFWELTQLDSPAEAVLAVVFLLGLTVTLAWGASRVICIARRSIMLHKNPAYILFSDPKALNKWGFLYIQFRASAYYFIVPLLVYTFIKALFVGLAQGSGVAQAVGFVILEAAALIAASVLRPWMDKRTNTFNIAIYVVNFLNAICLLIYTNVFHAPMIVVGAFGVVLFVLNAVFSLVLLVMVSISTAITLFRKDPDARYQAMADDRASFVKSQTQLTNVVELDALAATARGEKHGRESDEYADKQSLSSSRSPRMGSRSDSAARSVHSLRRQDAPPSPFASSVHLFPATQTRSGSPLRSPTSVPDHRLGSPLGERPTHAVRGGTPQSAPRTPTSPWHRGAGYEL